jgi:Fe-S-cluster-containing dehydrogenase component
MKPAPPRTACERRTFLGTLLQALTSVLLLGRARAGEELKPVEAVVAGEGYNSSEHLWGMGIDVNKCIGCGRCVEACKTENHVPRVPFFTRTWVERYRIPENAPALIDSPDAGINSFKDESTGEKIIRSFFVPKLCNQCKNPPCVQVCPVGATFKNADGVVLVDKEYCIGCRYCIQACPYGARYLDPVTRTAEKCTFCYHRLVRGLTPACVEACPTQARVFGELEKKASPLARFLRVNKIGVLKPFLNTEPKVVYANLDLEVK